MPDGRVSPAPLAEPIIVCAGPECTFYRSAAAAIAAGIPTGASPFDGRGLRLELSGHDLVSTDADGGDELADLLRRWLGHMDAIRESTANWSLALLVRASLDHLGYTA